MQLRDLERVFVYHSPQYPGYTCWLGLWNMPDESVMCSFIQATGPISGRPKAPDDLREYLSWPPEGHGDDYDMTGLDLRHVHLRSTDFGRTWELVSADPFKSPMNGAAGEVEEVIPDDSATYGGVIVRGVWGVYLPYDRNAPQNGFVQRSNDGSATWGPPEVVYDREATLFCPKRLRPLRDGRMLIGGGLYFVHPEHNTRRGMARDMTMALFVGDREARNWQGPVSIIPDDQRRDFAGEEFDWVELDNGDLLCVLRTETENVFDARDPGQQRRITRVVKTADSWAPTRVDTAPFPHSGHPEMVRTDDGLALHFATSGISVSADDGESWTHFDLSPDLSANDWARHHDWARHFNQGTPYYPKAVQMANGEILALGHIGGDDGYGMIDQSVVGIRFRLDG